jgi:TRAP transporter TAXI family solute receptor
MLTGGDASEYTAIGRSLARVAKARKYAFHEYQSTGSVDNCRNVGEGVADFSITQNDIAYMARRGEDLFEGLRPYTDLEAVCSLYPEALQIVTLEETGIESVRDLVGKRVAIGPRGSGTRVNAVEVLEAYGIGLEDLKVQERLSYLAALRALQQGRVDALFMTTAFPSRPIEAFDKTKKIRLLPIEDEVAERLVTERPFLGKITIPKGTYDDLSVPVPTLGVQAMVVTHAGVDQKKVEALLSLLFESQDVREKQKEQLPHRPLRALENYSEGSSMVSYISRTRASQGISIPFHPAAAKYLKVEAGGK